MKKLIFSIFILSAISVNAQQWQWLKSPTAVTGNMTYQGMDIDEEASVYTIGNFIKM